MRRSYALELALGVACAALAVWVVVERESARRPGQPSPPQRSGTSEPAALEVPPTAVPLAGVGRETPPDAALDEKERADAPPTDSEVPVAPAPAELIVRVLDARGRPVPGVPLVLDLRADPPARRPGRPLPLTDETGRARLALDWFAPPTGASGPYAYVLRALLPVLDSPSIDLGARPPSPGIVTLVLPACGRVRIQVTDEEDHPVPSAASVYAHVQSAAGATTAVAEVREGCAELPCVALDSTLELRVTYDDQRGPSRRTSVAGPTYVGETVECSLRIAPEWPLLRFRVLDERGLALANASLALHVNLEPLSPQVGHVKTDREGRAELRLMAAHVAQGERRLEVTRPGPAPRGAAVDLPFELARGQPTDLGDLFLRPWVGSR